MKDYERYEATAALHQQDADAAMLDNVRDRCQRSADAWTKMAVQARRTDLRKEARERGDG